MTLVSRYTLSYLTFSKKEKTIGNKKCSFGVSSLSVISELLNMAEFYFLIFPEDSEDMGPHLQNIAMDIIADVSGMPESCRTISFLKLKGNRPGLFVTSSVFNEHSVCVAVQNRLEAVTGKKKHEFSLSTLFNRPDGLRTMPRLG